MEKAMAVALLLFLLLLLLLLPPGMIIVVGVCLVRYIRIRVLGFRD